MPTVSIGGAPVSPSQASAFRSAFGLSEPTPITEAKTDLASADTAVIFDSEASGAPKLTTMAAISAFVGGSPSATAPAAFTAGQWTATAGNGQVVLNITALPSDGGSAITALQYRIGSGSAVNLTGTGTGERTISGLANGEAVDLQIRAVNAIGAAAWSDVKTRTPSAGGGGAVTWSGVSTTTGNLNQSGAGVVLAKPAGTTASDVLVAIMSGVSTARAAQIEVPPGWTLRGTVHSDFAGGLGLLVYTAAGDVADVAWKISAFEFEMGYFDVHRLAGASVSSPVAAIATRAAHTWGTPEAANMPTPSVTAPAGAAIISHYYQAQSDTAVGTPTAGYTRQVDIATPGRRSTLVRSNVIAGATGDISHGANAAWEGRAGVTIAIQS